MQILYMSICSSKTAYLVFIGVIQLPSLSLVVRVKSDSLNYEHDESNAQVMINLMWLKSRYVLSDSCFWICLVIFLLFYQTIKLIKKGVIQIMMHPLAIVTYVSTLQIDWGLFVVELMKYCHYIMFGYNLLVNSHVDSRKLVIVYLMQVLIVNQVIEILLKFIETKDWKFSFFEVSPQRKRPEADPEGS